MTILELLEKEQQNRCACGATSALRLIDAHGVVSLMCRSCIARARNETRERKQCAAAARRALREYHKAVGESGR